MSEITLKTGDKVKLKTGEPGLPIMVINSWHNTEIAICKWFDTVSNEYKKENLHISTLVKVED